MFYVVRGMKYESLWAYSKGENNEERKEGSFIL
jgi:hypothetical protein